MDSNTKTLHILNGDSTLEMLKVSGLEGDTAVWRDVLSDGPSHPKVGSDEYWQVRTDYMCQAFEVSPEEFEEKSRQEFSKIEAFPEYEEVVLWFEYDLFCQVNMIALLHWFHEQERGETRIALICVGWEDGHDDLVALGHLTPQDFPGLYERRRIMGTHDFGFASDAWLAWCSDDPTDLENYVLLSSNEFPYLSAAFEAHFRRFPSVQTGLTDTEEEIVDQVSKGITEERKLVGHLLRWQKVYGFGDLQYFQAIAQLKPLFEGGESLRLKPEVAAAYKAGEAINLIKRDYRLGGARADEWAWDGQKKELISVRN